MTAIIGDVLDVLPGLPERSVQCVVTSPPYLGLRDYGVTPSAWPAVEFSPMPGLPPMTIPAMDACLGLEPDPWAFIGHLVHVFREVRRALADDGVAFVNLGDSYNNFRAQMGPGQAVHGRDKLNGKPAEKSRRRGFGDLKEKDLIGIPWRFAFAAQADGWFLRQDVIWSKPNPMPESVTDRCTKAHEYLFVLTKQARYFWDAAAIAEAGTTDERPRSTWDARRDFEPIRRGDPGSSGHVTRTATLASGQGRNKRSVWTIATQPYPGAHFATFPPDLVEPCIKAGSRLDDMVLDPFGGSGTTASVAAYLGRRWTVIDVNPANEALIAERMVKRETPLFDDTPAKPVQEALL